MVTRVALSDFFDRVSGGWLIKCFDELIAEETVQLVRGQDIHVLARYSNLIPVERGHAAITRMAFEAAKTAMEGRAAAFTYQPCRIGIPIEEVRKNTNLERAGRMFRDIERLIAKQTTDMESAPMHQRRPHTTRYINRYSSLVPKPKLAFGRGRQLDVRHSAYASAD